MHKLAHIPILCRHRRQHPQFTVSWYFKMPCQVTSKEIQDTTGKEEGNHSRTDFLTPNIIGDEDLKLRPTKRESAFVDPTSLNRGSITCTQKRALVETFILSND